MKVNSSENKVTAVVVMTSHDEINFRYKCTISLKCS